MSTELTTQTAQPIAIVPVDATGNTLSRLSIFETWQQETGRMWYNPDLAAYRDTLLERMKASSTKAHLSTIRARYQTILRDNHTRDVLFEQAAQELERTGQEDNPANRRALVEELLTRLQNAIHPSASAVETETKQDVVDSEDIRLTLDQAQTLIDVPGLIPLPRLRDTAVIALLLSTGIRERELCSLDVADLRQTVNGALGLHIRKGKGCKTRFVPYGAFEPVLVLVDAWLERAGITEGAVFRGFYRGGAVRDNRLTPRSVQRILDRYPVVVGGQAVTLKPHDCRRSYARVCYVELGMDILALSQNLGHSSIETTKGYVGNLDIDKRKPRGRAFSFDLSQLA